MPRVYTRRPLAERFWEKVNKSGGCWEWQGARSRKGYGTINEGGHNGRFLRANRVAWELTNGPVPDGLHVLHRCDNPPCVRPDHLFLGTIKDNWHDMDDKGRWSPPRLSGERHGRAKLTAGQVEDVRRAYATGGVTQIELARRHGVSKATIWLALKGHTWAHG